jgi:hypothetical protein
MIAAWDVWVPMIVGGLVALVGMLISWSWRDKK